MQGYCLDVYVEDLQLLMYIPTVYFLLSFKFPDRKLQTVKKKEKKEKKWKMQLVQNANLPNTGTLR